MTTNWIKFTVIGRGTFPVDMLRYDECFPRDSQSAYAIINENGDDGTPRGHRTVTLVTHKHFITPERWRSFGWVVKENRQ